MVVVRSMWRTLDRDLLRGIGLICASVGAIGASYGATAAAAGFPVWMPALTGALVLAGSSEFLFVGIIAAGGNPFTAAAAGLLVNARHVPYGLAVSEVIEPGWRRIPGSHVMNDESVVIARAQPDLARKRAAYRLCGLGVLVCWPVGALLGSIGGTRVHDTGAFGLDAMFPAVILALILPALRDRITRRAALAGAAVALAATAFLPAGLPELLALSGLALAAGPGRRPSQPEPEPQEHGPEQHPVVAG
jgi:4-azaleucine resistance transporter AzlC